jgi:hypothetical protein
MGVSMGALALCAVIVIGIGWIVVSVGIRRDLNCGA